MSTNLLSRAQNAMGAFRLEGERVPRRIARRDAECAGGAAAGVPEASIQMKPPMFVEVGAGTTEARRVEITQQ